MTGAVANKPIQLGTVQKAFGRHATRPFRKLAANLNISEAVLPDRLQPFIDRGLVRLNLATRIAVLTGAGRKR